MVVKGLVTTSDSYPSDVSTGAVAVVAKFVVLEVFAVPALKVLEVGVSVSNLIAVKLDVFVLAMVANA